MDFSTILFRLGLSVICAAGVAACGDDSEPADSGGEEQIAASEGAWTVYPDPAADGSANPAEGIDGSAAVYALDGERTKFVLSVSGLPATTTFGVHLHKLPCDDNKAGGHYQHEPAPEGAASDPRYANTENEVWLDVTTDGKGSGASEAVVAFRPRAGEASSVVLHAQPTAEGGIAGPKLACISLKL